ncbi:MAG: hypothetical protein ACO1SV_00825 [Fimbriimonas sp.]
MKKKGAVPSGLREFCRQAVEEAIPLMAAVARGEGEKVTSAERMKAFDVIAKFSAFDLDSVVLDDDAVARAAVRVVFAMYGGERLEEFSERLATELERIDGEDD